MQSSMIPALGPAGWATAIPIYTAATAISGAGLACVALGIRKGDEQIKGQVKIHFHFVFLFHSEILPVLET